MKLSRIMVPAIAMSLMFGVSASAEEDSVPLDQGIVVDTETDAPETPKTDEETGTDVDTGTEDGTVTGEEVEEDIDSDAVDDEANAQEEEEEDAPAEDEDTTELPVDEGESVDEGKEVEEDAVVPPAKVEVNKTPKVEPLAQTGLDSTVGLTLGFLTLAGAVGLVVSRRLKRQVVE